MKTKLKNNILVWATVAFSTTFALGTIIPISINFANINKVFAEFQSNISFTDDTKYGKYYDSGTQQGIQINQEKLNTFWVNHSKDTEMQLAEIIYGITNYMYQISSLTSYSWECKIYDFEHRITSENIFQFKYWYEINVNFNPNDSPYVYCITGYRFYVDWTSPAIIPSDNTLTGIYNILYKHYYAFQYRNWELINTDYLVNIYSLVFANQEFDNA